jgi:uncharacterized protein YndB with AHSA1/START domain
MTTTTPTDLGTVHRDGDSVTLRYERTIPTTIDDAWCAITEAERLAQWFMPTTIEPRVGGAVRSNDATQGHTEGHVTVWEPPKTLAYTWQWHGPDGKESEPPTEVRWELSPAEGGTRLVFSHTRLSSTHDHVVGYGAGWHGFLDKLVDHHVDSMAIERQVEPAYEELFASL